MQVRNRSCFTSQDVMLPQGCSTTIETRPCGVPICPGLCRDCLDYEAFPSYLNCTSVGKKFDLHENEPSGETNFYLTIRS